MPETIDPAYDWLMRPINGRPPFRYWPLFGFNLVLIGLAFFWRRLLFRTNFIAVVGSVGKTTTKEALGAILSASLPGVQSRGNLGARYELPRTILRARPWHRYAVAEVGVVYPGAMWRSAWLLKPDMVLFLGVKRNHSVGFETMEKTAEEKGKMLEGMARGGVAILNADCPHTVRLSKRLKGPTCWFGTSPENDYWGDNAASQWPERFSFTAHHGAESVPVKTRLVGKHWMSSMLAALAAAHRMGIPLREAAKPLAKVPPFPARLEPVEIPSGAILLRDEYNGSVDSFTVALEILREYRGGRRILMVSDVVDLPGHYRKRRKYIAHLAADVCDVCAFVGEKASYGANRAIDEGMPRKAVFGFPSLPQATAFLQEQTRHGDLILLRGRQIDNLTRILEPLLPATALAIHLRPHSSTAGAQ